MQKSLLPAGSQHPNEPCTSAHVYPLDVVDASDALDVDELEVGSRPPAPDPKVNVGYPQLAAATNVTAPRAPTSAVGFVEGLVMRKQPRRGTAYFRMFGSASFSRRQSAFAGFCRLALVFAVVFARAEPFAPVRFGSFTAARFAAAPRRELAAGSPVASFTATARRFGEPPATVDRCSASARARGAPAGVESATA